jgi:glutaredoxin
VNIVVYGKSGCEKCSAAKRKLELMETPFRLEDFERLAQLHDGWRDDNSAAVLAEYHMQMTLPIISIDGELLDYPKAMKLVKDRQRKKRVVSSVTEETLVS